MKLLTALRPKWIVGLRPNSGEGIEFDCPVCERHRLVAYFANPKDGGPPAPWPGNLWERDGDDFESLTIAPSIQYPCFHGWIDSGYAIAVSESPLTVMVTVDGETTPLALSPGQALTVATEVVKAVTALRARRKASA